MHIWSKKKLIYKRVKCQRKQYMSAACKPLIRTYSTIKRDLPEKICPHINKTSEPSTNWVGCGQIAGAQWCHNSCVSQWETERGAQCDSWVVAQLSHPARSGRDPWAWMKKPLGSFAVTLSWFTLLGKLAQKTTKQPPFLTVLLDFLSFGSHFVFLSFLLFVSTPGRHHKCTNRTGQDGLYRRFLHFLSMNTAEALALLGGSLSTSVTLLLTWFTAPPINHQITSSSNKPQSNDLYFR